MFDLKKNKIKPKVQSELNSIFEINCITFLHNIIKEEIINDFLKIIIDFFFQKLNRIRKKYNKIKIFLYYFHNYKRENHK